MIPIRAINLVLFGIVALLVVAIPMVMTESNAMSAKKHFGPVPFPENLIPHPHGHGHDEKQVHNNG